MAQAIARSAARISFPLAVVMIAFGCGGAPTAPLPLSTSTAPTPTPISPPTLTAYHVSGIVTGDNDSPVAGAQLTLSYDHSFKTAKASTDARGHYSFAFDTAQR